MYIIVRSFVHVDASFVQKGCTVWTRMRPHLTRPMTINKIAPRNTTADPTNSDRIALAPRNGRCFRIFLSRPTSPLPPSLHNHVPRTCRLAYECTRPFHLPFAFALSSTSRTREHTVRAKRRSKDVRGPVSGRARTADREAPGLQGQWPGQAWPQDPPHRRKVLPR